MNRVRTVVALTLLCFAVLGSATTLLAGPDVNEVGAVLVFPTVLNESTVVGPQWQTFVTVLSASANSHGVRLFMVGGTSCGWCDAGTVSLLGNDTETLRVSRNFTTGNTEIKGIDSGTTAICPGDNGFLVAVLVDDTTGDSLLDNVLLGSSIVRNEATGASLSVESIPFSGVAGGDGDLNLEFDALEYQKFPRTLTETLLVPDAVGGLDASLSLFTLNFNNGTPPLTNCNLNATDETGVPFFTPFQFGCWTRIPLESISSLYSYTNWGLTSTSEEITTQLECFVDAENKGSFDTGGVHGAVDQYAPAGTRLRRKDATSPVLATDSAWGRPMKQSIQTGDAVRVSLEACNGIDDDGDSIIDEGCDVDGDGYCVASLGFSGMPDECSAGLGDCAPADGATYPGAPEINDGLDNNCPGDDGFGVVDELEPTVSYPIPGNDEAFCWDPQPGASQYELARSDVPTFIFGPNCLFAVTSDSCLADSDIPLPGQLFHYLVRPSFPFSGSYGVSSVGERTSVCS